MTAEHVYELPWPLIVVGSGGDIVTATPSLQSLLGLQAPSVRTLQEKFVISRFGGGALSEQELPWRRAARGESFTDDLVWVDRRTAHGLLLHLHVRYQAQSGHALIAFENIADVTLCGRLADLAGSLGTALLVPDDPASVAQAIVEELAKALGADAVFLSTSEGGGECLRLLASVGLPEDFVYERRVVPLSTPLVLACAARTREIQEVERIEDLPAVDFSGTRRLLQLDLHSFVAVPLLAFGELTGVLALARRQYGKLSPLDRRLLYSVASACALGLHQARARLAEREEAARLRTVQSATSAIQPAMPLNELLQRLVEQACELTHARHGALGVLSPSCEELVELVFVGASREEANDGGAMAEMRRRLGGLVREGRQVQVGGAERDPCEPDAPAPPGVTAPALLGAPVRMGGETFGHLFLSGKRDDAAFTEEDGRLLDLFAAQSALAISYARKVKLADDAYAELEQLREEFAAVAAHDLRNPISAIVLQVEDLLHHAAGDIVMIPVKALERLQRCSYRVSQMANDLLDASRVEVRRMELVKQPVALGEAAQELVAQLRPALGDHPIDVEVVGSPPPVHADPMRLDQVVANLLDNAVKYSDAGTPIRVIVLQEGAGATLTVEDRGVGIAKEQIPALFERFRRLKQRHGRGKGLGLGLYIIKGIVDAHGGRVWVDSEPGRGSRFHIWLPAAGASEPLVAPLSPAS